MVAKVLEKTLLRAIVAMTHRSRSNLDDLVVSALKRPIFLSVVLVGLYWSAEALALEGSMASVVVSSLATVATLLWAGAALRVGEALLNSIGARGAADSLIQPRTLPVFDMLLKVAVIGAAVYFALLSWEIDLTAWLASAGIVGLAIGFAAKDTLANLFSGIFIVADAPYKVGDFIVLDGELRGRVTKIGIRSTRVLTLDDIEVTVPNAVIAASKIVNESGGPDVKQRIRVVVECAYGSDIDQVRAVLLACAGGVAHVAEAPAPEVRFAEFGASGLRFELRVWIVDAGKRDTVVDVLHCNIYKSFHKAGIEIPYSKHDLYLKEVPERLLRQLGGGASTP